MVGNSRLCRLTATSKQRSWVLVGMEHFLLLPCLPWQLPPNMGDTALETGTPRTHTCNYSALIRRWNCGPLEQCCVSRPPSAL